MRKELITLACVLGICGSATGAFAGAYGEAEQPEEMPAPAPAPAPAPVVESEPEYGALGPYIGVGGVYAIELFDGNIDAGNSNGFNVRAGYRVHPNVAVEALYEYYSEFDTDPAGNISGWSVSANAKAYPMLGRWQPYALLGLGYLAGEAEFNPAPGSNDDGGFMMRFGGGFDAHITEHIVVGPEIAYVLPFGDVDDLDFLTISGGIRYAFN